MLGFMFLKQDSSTGTDMYGLQVLIIIHDCIMRGHMDVCKKKDLQPNHIIGPMTDCILAH